MDSKTEPASEAKERNGFIISGKSYLISKQKVQDGDTLHCVVFGYVSAYTEQRTKFGDTGIVDLHYDRVKFPNGEEYVYWPDKFMKLEPDEEITRLKAENEELGKMYANASAKLRDLQKEYSDTKANLHRAYNGLENYKQVKAELERERELIKELVVGLKRCHGNMTLNVPSAQRAGYKEWISCREHIASLIEKAKN